MRVLTDIQGRPGARTIADDVDVAKLPMLASGAQITDAYLVELAQSKGLRLATLDERLCAIEWASNVAFHPFHGNAM